MKDPDSCVFASCKGDSFLDLMWIHESARKHWRLFDEEEKKCSCECKTNSLMMKTCQINDTFVSKQPIKFMPRKYSKTNKTLQF